MSETSKEGSSKHAPGLLEFRELDDMPWKNIHTQHTDNDSATSLSGPIDAERLLNWKTHTHIYSILSAYGGPSCFLPTNAYYVLGSTKGAVLIFDDREYLRTILAPQLKGTKSNVSVRSRTLDLNTMVGLRASVVMLAISWDGTHLAAAYDTGDVFIWDLNAAQTVNDDENDDEAEESNTDDNTPSKVHPLSAILHITTHVGAAITGISFIDKRHTGLVVSDINGTVALHSGHRTRLWQLTYSTHNILVVPSNEMLLKTLLEPLPATTTGKGKSRILAILTNKLFCLLSMDPKHQDNRDYSNDNLGQLRTERVLYSDSTDGMAPNSSQVTPNNDIAWYSDGKQESSIIYIAYFINNNITAFVFRMGRGGVFQPIQTKVSWASPETVLSLTWISKNLLMLLTISHQMIVVEPYNNFSIVMKLDLLAQNLLIPPNKFFKYYRSKLFLLTHYSLKIARFNQWPTLILKKVQTGDYLGALIQLDKLSKPNFRIPLLLGLKENPQERREQLRDTFNNLTFAALRFLLKRHDLPDVHDALSQLMTFSIGIQTEWFPDDKYTILTFLDLAWDSLVSFGDDVKRTFISTIRDLILSGTVDIVPPSIFQQVVTQTINAIGKEDEVDNKADIFTEMQGILFRLDPSCWDVDLLVRLLRNGVNTDSTCNQQLLPYIWNVKFQDFRTPLVDLLCWIRDGNTSNCELFKIGPNSDGFSPDFVYTYISYTYIGKYYPSGQEIDSEISNKVKAEVSYILFNGVTVDWPFGSDKVLYVNENHAEEFSFPYFHLILNFNTPKCLSMLNEILEDPFLNDQEDEVVEEAPHTLSVSRQYIIDILIGILHSRNDEISETDFLVSAFLAINIPKYPQFIHISGIHIDLIIQTMLNYQGVSQRTLVEAAIESLLPVYEPVDPESFILDLKEKGYLNLLTKYFKKVNRFADMFRVCLIDLDSSDEYHRELIIATVDYILRFNLKQKNISEFYKIVELFKDNFSKILESVGVQRMISYVSQLDASLNLEILEIPSSPGNDSLQHKYLNALFGNSETITLDDSELSKRYIDLSVRYKSSGDLYGWLRKLNFDSLSISSINNICEKLVQKKDFRALSIIYFRQGDYERSAECLIKCIEKWFDGPCLRDDETELMDLINSAIATAREAEDYEIRQKCWIALLSSLVKQYSTVSRKVDSSQDKRQLVNKTIQHVFVKLSLLESEKTALSSPDSDIDPQETRFWKILAGVLEQQDIILMKIEDVGGLLKEVFINYELEEQISELILKILEDSASEIVDQYRNSMKQGWSIVNNECEVCGKKLWGAGLEQKIARIWEARKKKQHVPKAEIFNGEVVLFRCNHGFHTKCLENLGQGHKRYSCLTCYPE
ncbi:CORVET complex membrane-binding subunit [Maudiozyma humilis]|uniref:CORVET complex membrane-binding subunit n=1 Tax=Maudiozyma humilis TaxID=51915 RepID=A0AAV5S0D4_MAUHU|nr:CORVET complex membrane-binding subunit [Kazachstania humilis]